MTISGSGFDVAGGVSCAWQDDGQVLTAASVLSPTLLSCLAPPYVELMEPASPRFVTSVRVVDAAGLSTGPALSFAYEPAAVLLSLYPAFTFDAAPSSPIITVSGSQFVSTANASCEFGSVLSPALWLDSETLLCSAPAAGTLGSVPLRVSLHQSGDWSNSLPFAYYAEPTVISVTPAAGSVTGGTTVLVRGSNFLSACSVWCSFGSQQVPAAVLSQSSLSCSSPAAPLGNLSIVTAVPLSITVNALDWEASSALTFTYYPLTSAVSLSPAHGLAVGGNEVTVTGLNFVSGDSQCSFGGVTAPNSSVLSSTSLLCIAPAYATLSISSAAAVAVQVVHAALGTADPVPSLSYLYTPLPALSRLYPANASTAGGTALTLYGSNFVSSVSYQCLFNGSAAVTAAWLTASALVCSSPASASAGVVPVAVVDVGFPYTTSPVLFSYTAPVLLTSLHPRLGPYTGGTAVTLTGSGFFPSPASSWCLFDTSYAPLTFLNASTASCVSPARSGSGQARVSLTFNSADFTSSLPFVFTPVPELLFISPSHGPQQGGGTLTITGLHFSNSSQCAFDGVTSNSSLLLSSQQLTCAVPPAAGQSQLLVSVYSAAIRLWTAQSLPYLYDVEMSVAAVSPSPLYFPGSTQLTVTGSSFPPAASDLSCLFNGSSAVSASFVSSTLCLCPSPPLAPGSYSLQLAYQQASRVSVNAALLQVSLLQPSVLSLSPALGPVDRAVVVTLTGANFVPSPSLCCVFQQLMIAAQFLSSSQIVCTLPPQSQPGAFLVEMSNNGVEVTTQAAAFTFTIAPSVQAVLPVSGPAGGGTELTVYGGNFAAAAVVQIGSVLVVPQSVSEGALVLLTPAMSASSVSVEVSNDGVWFTHDGVQFSFQQPVQLSSITPASGIESGGDTLLLSATTAAFVDTPSLACAFTFTADTVLVQAVFVSSSLISCVTPAVADGPTVASVSVSNNGQDWSSPSLSFAYFAPAFLLSVSPAAVSALTAFTLTVSGSGFLAQSVDQCVLGSLLIPASSASDTALVCAVPAALQVGSVVVTAASSSLLPQSAYATRPASILSVAPVLLEVSATAVVYALWPTQGGAAGGTPVIVIGSGFDVGNGMLCLFGWPSLYFETVAAVSSASLISCPSPPSPLGAAASVPVQVVSAANPGYPAVRVVSRHFSYYSEFSISSVSPLSLPAYTASVVTVIGSSFPLESSSSFFAYFGSTPPALPLPSSLSDLSALYADAIGLGLTACTAWNSSCLLCSTPAVELPFTSLFHLTANLVDFSPAPVSLSFFALPVVWSVFPIVGPSTGGTLLTVGGANFQPTAALSCAVGGVVHPAVYLSSTAVSCVTPPAVNGSVVAVSVSLDMELWTAEPAWFTYVAAPVLSSLFPSRVLPSGGDLVLLRGDNFQSSVPLLCGFGGVAYGEAVYVQSNAVVCSAPPLSALSLSMPRSGSGSAVGVELSVNGQDWSDSQLQLVFEPSARVTAVVPAQLVDASVSSPVTVLGFGFQPGPLLLCSFGAVTVAASFINQSAVSCVPPAAPGLLPLPVAVSSNGVDFTSDDAVNFQYAATPSLMSVSPASVPLQSALPLTVNGENFVSPAWCIFPSNEQTAAVLLNPTTLQCAAPVLTAAGASSVSLYFTDLLFTSNSLPLLYYAAPMTLSISPSHSPASGGTAVTLTGQGFISGAIFCQFQGTGAIVPASFLSSSSCVCATPVGLQPGPLLVAAVDGLGNAGSQAAELMLDAAASVTAIQPAVVTVGTGAVLTVVGRQFLHTPQLQCRINGVQVNASFQSNSSLSCRCPPLPAPGLFSLEVSNNAQDFTSSGLSFTYAFEVTLSRLLPAASPASGNTLITAIGSNFDVSAQSVQCVYGAAALTGRVLDSSHVLCPTPAAANLSTAASVPLTLSFHQQSVSSSQPYSLLPPPLLTQLAPASGAVTGGTQLTLTGANFASFPLFCLFNTSTAVQASLLSASTVVCTTPPSSSAGPQPLQLSLDGVTPATAAVIFTYSAAIQLQRLWPAAVAETGGQLLTVYVANSAFVPGLTVLCGFGTAGSGWTVQTAASLLSASAVQCVAPAALSLQSINVSLSSNGQDWAAPLSLQYTPLATLLAASPAVAPADADTLVTLSGSNFPSPASAAVFCLLGATTVPATLIDGSSLSCTAPPQSSAGSVWLDLVDSEGAALTSGPSLLFSYSARPLLLSISPAAGPVTGGTQLTLSVAGLSSGSAGCLSCAFASSRLVSASLINASAVSCITPPLASLLQSQLSDVSLELGCPGLLSASGLTFSYLPAASLSAVSPPALPASGGVELTLLGSGFVQTAGLSCVLNGTLVPAVALSASALRCLAPALPVGPVSAELSVDGQQRSSTGLTVLAVSSPALLSVSPAAGPNTGGTLLTVTGSGFGSSAGLFCLFSSGAQQPALVVNSTVLLCTSPPSPPSQPGLSDSLSLLLYDAVIAAASASTVFSYFSPADPAVLSVAPAVGQWTGGTPLTLAGVNFQSGAAAALSLCRFVLDTDILPSSPYAAELPSVVSTPLYQAGGQWLCLTPAVLQANATATALFRVEVAFNGVDATDSLQPFVFVPSPLLAAVQPAAGSVDGGTVLTISGSVFTSPALVFSAAAGYELWCAFLFPAAGPVFVSATVLDDGELSCISPSSPSSAAVVANVSLSFNQQELSISPPLPFSYYEQATLNALTPLFTRYSGGTVLSITGTGFLPLASLSCCVNGQWLPASFVSSTELSCVAPAVADFVQAAAVTVSNVGQPGDASNALSLLYLDYASVLSISPTLAWTAGGVRITVTGSDFLASSLAFCAFGQATTAATVSSCSAAWPHLCTRMHCLTPALAEAGTLPFAVSDNGQELSTSLVSITFYSAPVLTSLSPSSGLYTGGMPVQVFAQGLFELSSDWCCRFDGSVVVSAAYSPGLVGSDWLLCDSPAWAGPAVVSLDISADCLHFANDSLPFSFIATSTIAAVWPPAGPEAGHSLVTLSGSFTAIAASLMQCSFGGLLSTVTAFNATTLQCYAPPAAAPGAVQLSVLSASTAITPVPVSYSYYAQGSVTAMQPALGSVGGGTSLTLTGSGFVDNGFFTCQLNASLQVTCTVLSSTIATCITPPSPSGAQGTVSVEVSNNAQDYWPVPALFTYLANMTVTAMSPTCGACTGSTALYLTGFGFSNTWQLLLSMNGTLAACSYLNASMILCPTAAVDCSWMAAHTSTLPAYAGQSVDPHQLTLPVFLSDNGRDFQATGLNYTYTLPLSGLSASQSTSVERGFTPVFVHGLHFVNVSTLSCRFNSSGLYEVTAAFLSDSLLLCLTPAHLNATVSFEVSNNGVDWALVTAAFSYLPTLPGFYVDNYTLTACPPGTYCVGSALATNYTLCPLGTYQPSWAQSSCLPCSRGSYCPSLGMSEPTVCTAGFVCPTASLLSASTYCPAGYWCEAGTLTSVGILDGQPLPAEYGLQVMDGWRVSLLSVVNAQPQYSNQTQTVGGITFYIDWTSPQRNYTDLYRDAGQRVKAGGINPTGESRAVYWFHLTSAAGVTNIFLSAYDGLHRNVWKSNGLSAGTVSLEADNGVGLLAGFTPEPAGPEGDNPVFLGVVGGSLFFTASDAAYGLQIWFYDAAADAGTAFRVPVNIPSLLPGAAIAYLTNTSQHVYFSLTTGGNTTLWRSDSSEAQEVSQLAVSSYLGSLYSDLLFFAVNGSLPACQLWSLNAASLSLQLVQDVSAAGSYNLSYLDAAYFSFAADVIGTADNVTGETALYGRIYLAASNAATLAAAASPSVQYPAGVTDVWESDGSAEGTALLSNRPWPCTAGFYCAPGSTSGSAVVDEASYDVLETVIAQLAGVANLTWLSRRLLTVTPNDPGYCDAGDSACIDALLLINADDSRTLNSSAFATPQTLLLSALPCLDGYLCPAASTSPHGAGQCPTGYYCSHGLAISCPAGSQCEGYGSFYPTECAPGSYAAFDGQSLCQPCPLGYSCPDWGMQEPLGCEAGIVCNDVGLARGQLCPPGLYCLPLTYSLDSSAPSTMLYGGLTGLPPVLCPPGAFCLGGVGNSSVLDGDEFHPQSCTPGFYCTIAASSPLGTGLCAKGHYCPRGSTAPIPTLPGYFSYTTGAQFPSPCLPGTWAPSPAMVQCDVCPAGYECPFDATYNLTSPYSECAAGYYRPALESFVACEPCPEGTWSNQTRLGTIDGCQICEAGYVCAEAGRTVPPTESNAQFPLSALCPAGYVCLAGTNSSTAKDLPCPAGFYCDPGTTNATKYSTECASGFFCPPGSTNATAEENICPAGYFCPAGTPNSPLFIAADKCPIGTTSNPGQSDPLECYKTCTYGSVDSCVVVAQANALGNGSVLELEPLAYAVVQFDFASVYAQPIGAQLLYNNHFRISVYLQGERQNMSFYFNALSGQPELVSMSLFAMQSEPLSVLIDILHGYYIQAAPLFVGVANYSLYYPSRASIGSAAQFFALLTEDKVEAQNLQLPLNMVLNDQVSVIVNNAAFNIGFPAIQDSQADLLQDASYWRFATYAQKASGLVTLPFLPFFSSCEGYDGNIPLGHLFEEEAGCALVQPAATVPISDFGITVSPVADTCDVAIQCTYEESMALSPTTRWFELPDASIMFYLTQMPWSAADFTSPSAALFLALVSSSGAIPVTVSTDLVLNTTQMQIPRTVVLDIGYYQVTPYSKQIITATVNLTDIIPIPASYSASEDATLQSVPGPVPSNTTRLNQYTLLIVYHPLSWLDLLNSFTLPTVVYTVVFLIIGLAAVLIMAVFWLVNRLLTRRKGAGSFRFWTFAQIIIPPPLLGSLLAVLPVLCGVLLVLLLFKYMYPVAWQNTTGNYSDILALTAARIEYYRIGRVGAMLVIFGGMLTWIGSCMFVPQRDVVGRSTDMWQPVLWKRAHLMVVSIVMACFLSLVLQVSYSPFFASNIYACCVAFKFSQVFIDLLIARVMGEWLTSSPLMVSVMVTQYVVSMGAAVFEEFLLSFFLLFMVLIVERVYIDPYLKTFAYKLPLYLAHLKLRLLLLSQYEVKAQQQRQRIIALTEEMGSQTIEPMLNSLVLYANETTALLMNPLIVLFILAFAEETGIPANYSINSQDLQYYLLFCLLIILPQCVLDCFLMNTIECFHRYPVFDYMEFARYRFKTRQKRWKADEPNVDETLQARHQSVDQLCFSSQFYFSTALHNWGILLLVMGVTVMYSQSYNMFADSLLPLFFLFAVFSTMLSIKLAVALADRTRLWEKKSDSDSALVRRRLADKKLKAGQAATTKWKQGEDGATARSVNGGGATTRRANGGGATTRRAKGKGRTLTAMFSKHHHLNIKHEKHSFHRTVPHEVMAGQEMRLRFLQLNRDWLLRQLPSIFDMRAVERHREQLQQHLNSAIADRRRLAPERDKAELRGRTSRKKQKRRRRRQGGRTQRDGPDAPYSPQLRMIATTWLMRARRSLAMRALVADIAQAEAAMGCAQCGGGEGVEVEELWPLAGLLSQFDAEQDALCAGWTAEAREEALLPQWRLFYHQHQQFRARCWRCREEAEALMRQPRPASISEDEEEQEAEAGPTRWSFAVTSVAIRFVYLLKRAVARRAARLQSKDGQDLSDDDEQDDGDGVLKAAYRVRPTHAEAATSAHENISDDDSEGEDDLQQLHPALREEEGRLVPSDGQQAEDGGREGGRFDFTSAPHAAGFISSDSEGAQQRQRSRPAQPRRSLLGHSSSPAGSSRFRDDPNDEAADAPGALQSERVWRKHARQYSDFGHHRHEHRPDVDLFRSSLSGLMRADISSSSSDDDDEEAKSLAAVPAPVREEEEEVKEIPVVVLEPAPGYEPEEAPPGYAGRVHRLYTGRSASGSSGGSGDESDRRQRTETRGRRGRAPDRRSAVAATATRPVGASSTSSRGGISQQLSPLQPVSPRRGGRARPAAAPQLGTQPVPAAQPFASHQSPPAARTVARLYEDVEESSMMDDEDWMN